jgi:hypothetical protein
VAKTGAISLSPHLHPHLYPWRLRQSRLKRLNRWQ